jgi:plasmid maintenance system killer protein
MHFANPSVLWALFLLVIPIIIHLFKFRRYKQEYFPNIRFLQKVDQDQKAKRKLKDIFILISRLLALTALVLAFSLPFLGEKKAASKGNVISIYVDNSFSMENESEQGKLLDIAKKKAEEIALSFQPSDRFNLLTNDLETRHQRLVNRQAFLQFLYEVDLSASSVDMSDIYLRQLSLLENEPGFDQWVAIISDMQRSTSSIDDIEEKSDVQLMMIPIEADNYTNVYVDSVWFDDPVRQLAKSEVLNLRVVNESDEQIAELPIRLEINGQMKSMAALAIPARSYLDTMLYFTNDNIAGIQNAKLNVEDKPIEFDNDYYFSYSLKEKIEVIEIRSEQASNFYELVFIDSLYNFSSFSINQIDFQALSEADLIVFNGLNDIPSGLNSFIIKWIREGGDLFISPGEDLNAGDYKAFFSNLGVSTTMMPDTSERRVATIEIENEIFKGVLKREPTGKALPLTKKHYAYSFLDYTWQGIFQLQGNDAFLSTRKLEKGRVYLLAVATKESWSNWPRHALFITSMLRIAEESQRSVIMDHRIGDWSIIELPFTNMSSDRPSELIAQDGSVAFIPTQQLADGKLSVSVNDEIKKAGFYDLVQEGIILNTLAFNYSRKESDLRFYSLEEIQQWSEGKIGIKIIESVNRPIKKSTIREERPLWKYFIGLALLFLVVEILLIKLIKKGS